MRRFDIIKLFYLFLLVALLSSGPATALAGPADSLAPVPVWQGVACAPQVLDLKDMQKPAVGDPLSSPQEFIVTGTGFIGLYGPVRVSMYVNYSNSNGAAIPLTIRFITCTELIFIADSDWRDGIYTITVTNDLGQKDSLSFGVYQGDGKAAPERVW